jgi:hypothetical protein
MKRSYPLSCFMNCIKSIRSGLVFSNPNNIRSILLIRCNLVRETSGHCVDFSTAKLFCPNNLTSSHLHERGPSEESLCLIFDKDRVV